jgi:hypothetical protein
MNVQFSVFNSTLTFTEPFVFNADETVHLYINTVSVNNAFVKLNDDVYYLSNSGAFISVFAQMLKTIPGNVLFYDDALAYVATETDVSLSDIANKEDWKLALNEKIVTINTTLYKLVRSLVYNVDQQSKHPDLLQHSSGVQYLPKTHPLNFVYQVYQKATRYGGVRISYGTNKFGDAVTSVNFLDGDTYSFDLQCTFLPTVPTKTYRFTYHLVTNYFTYPVVPILSYTGWKSSGWQQNSFLPMIVLPIDLTKTTASLVTYNESQIYTRQSTDYDTELVNLNIFYNPRGIFLFPYVSSSVISKKYVVVISTLEENSTSHLFNFYDSATSMFPTFFFSNFVAQYKRTFYIASNKTATFPLSFKYNYASYFYQNSYSFEEKDVTAATAQAFTGDGKFLTTDNKFVLSDDKFITLNDVGFNIGEYNGYPYEGRKAVTDYKANFPYTVDFTNATTRSYLLLKIFNPNTSQFVTSISLPEPITIVFNDLVGTPTLTIPRGYGYKSLDNFLSEIQTFSPTNIKAIKKDDGIVIYMPGSNITVNSLTISNTDIFKIDPQVKKLQFISPHVCLAELPIFAWELSSPITFLGNSLTGTVAVDDIVTMLNARNNGIVVAKVIESGFTFLTFTSSSSFVIDATTTSEYYRLLGFKQPVSSTLLDSQIRYVPQSELFRVYYDANYNANNTTATGEQVDLTERIQGEIAVILDRGTIQYSFEIGPVYHWNTASNDSGTIYYPGDTLVVQGNVTLYLIPGSSPVGILYTVIYYKGSINATGEQNDPNGYSTGATVTVLDKGTIHDPNANFLYWTNNTTIYYPGTTFIMPAGGIQLTAHYDVEVADY